MASLWQISGDDPTALQGKSVDFVRFVNGLILTQARAGGLPDTAILLNEKDNAAEDGADAVVTQMIPAANDPMGRFGVPDRERLLVESSC